MFGEELKPAIRTMGRLLLSQRVVLLYKHSRLHTVAHTADTIQKVSFEVLQHIPLKSWSCPVKLDYPDGLVLTAVLTAGHSWLED